MSPFLNMYLIQYLITHYLCSLHRSQGISGRDITPFILNRVNDMTKGESLEASIQPLMPVVWTIVFTDSANRYFLTNDQMLLL